jgi:hypothetical protein
MRSGRFVSLLAVVALTMVGLIALSAPAAAQSATPAGQSGTYPEVVINAGDYKYDMPDSIPSGYVEVTMHNTGTVAHQAQFMKINDGKTYDEVQKALMSPNPDAAFGMVTFTGGANSVEAGLSQSVVLKLDPGNYVVLCFLTTPEGVPHYAMGMIKPVTVTQSTTQAQEPTADATVTLKDFAFSLPQNITAGTHTWKVTNDGPESHEMALLKLAPGVPAEAVMAGMEHPAATPAAASSSPTTMAMASPAASPAGGPPVAAAGGMGAIAPGTSAWVMVDLQPGNYIAVCFVPDPKTGKPHVELGMITTFTVS